jgi:molybdenum cofactor cytidylyltransferase
VVRINYDHVLAGKFKHNYTMSKIEIIILAAGASSRMGTPKQILPYKNTTLIGNAIQSALDSKCNSVVVVLGANADLIYPKIEINDRLKVVVNNNWNEGLSSSIKCGIETICSLNTKPDGVMIMSCDQPFVSKDIINKLIDKFEPSKHKAAAAAYSGSVGIPAIFHFSLLPNLLSLSGDKGAKNILLNQKENLISIDFPEGALDIDSMEDYAKI